ncbi:Carotenoid oxygenase [Ostreococcus tauri]|nr:Carotenoid oxygenase [Ostreococcus tauri]CEG01621.1 Carotenoid oxygenase [Ostreococcus tauri]|eukprot:XP_003080965.2 Carotenoid oxygenase [Ostreococcus tauri]
MSNPALSGNFAPVADELAHELACAIAGRLPRAIDGVYARNGPNPHREPALGVDRYHWFDGDGMVHAVRLGDGKATYVRRYVRTRGFERERASGEALYTGLRDINPIWRYLIPRLVEKCTLDVARPDSAYFVIQSKNTSSNALKYHGGRLLSLFESGSPYELAVDPLLTTKGLCDFNGSFTTADFWAGNFTAHPKICPLTKELIYMGYNLVALGPEQEGQTTITVGAIDEKSGKRTRKRTFKVDRPSMQHDVAITPTKIVLIDGPLIFNLSRVIQGGLPFSFEKESTLRVGYVPREGDDGPYWIDTDETCFAYHVVNAYEEGSKLVLDVCKSDETNALGMCQESQATRSTPSANPVCAGRDVAALWRWELDTASKSLISSTRMCEQPSDFPCINRDFTGLKYRYAYSVAYKAGTEPKDRMDIPTFDAVLKHDLDTGVTTRYDLGDGKTCGDIVFVPSEEPKSEDDGYLLVLTHIEGDDPRAELLVLDVSKEVMTEQCVVNIPVRVPYGFHCEYIPGPIPTWPL